VKGDWDAWNSRSLAEEPIARLILDGTVVRVQVDRKVTSISLLVVIGVREDGQKVLLGHPAHRTGRADRRIRLSDKSSRPPCCFGRYLLPVR
jgi:transposase-like protein